MALNHTESYEQDFSSGPDWMFYVIVIGGGGGGGAAFIVVTGVVLGCILRKKHPR